jgi:hypothetical protein
MESRNYIGKYNTALSIKLSLVQFEVATGKIPYDNFENLSEFGRLTLINNPGPKQLDASNANQYTVHFRNFVNAWYGSYYLLTVPSKIAFSMVWSSLHTI